MQIWNTPEEQPWLLGRDCSPSIPWIPPTNGERTLAHKCRKQAAPMIFWLLTCSSTYDINADLHTHYKVTGAQVLVDMIKPYVDLFWRKQNAAEFISTYSLMDWVLASSPICYKNATVPSLADSPVPILNRMAVLFLQSKFLIYADWHVVCDAWCGVMFFVVCWNILPAQVLGDHIYLHKISIVPITVQLQSS